MTKIPLALLFALYMGGCSKDDSATSSQQTYDSCVLIDNDYALYKPQASKLKA